MSSTYSNTVTQIGQKIVAESGAVKGNNLNRALSTKDNKANESVVVVFPFPNAVYPKPQRNVSIAAIRGAVRPPNETRAATKTFLYTL